MKKFIVVMLALTLYACGNKNYHEVCSADEMEDISGNYNFIGYTHWDSWGECDIYMYPENWYYPEGCYEAALEHEERHCDDHNYHAPGAFITNEDGAFCGVEPEVEKH